MKHLFQELMKPPILHYYISHFTPRNSSVIFEILADLRSIILAPAFLHPEHAHSQETLRVYWKNQWALASLSSFSTQMHPSMQALWYATTDFPVSRQQALTILEGFIYESDTQWTLFSMESQRNRLIHNLARTGECLLSPDTFRSPSYKADLQWCQKVVFYQYRGLLQSLWDCGLPCFQALKQEISTHKCSESFSSRGHKIFIRYHQSIANLIKNEDCEAYESYVRLSVWGIIRFLWSLIF